jgi:uncharacterized protein involved in exopolysaccharide biosynthesis
MLDRAPLSARTSIKVGVITFLVLTAISIGVQFSLPKTYVAVARIEIMQQRMAAERYRHPEVPVDPYFIQTELERIKSDAVLVQAARELRESPEAANFGKTWHTQMDDPGRARILRNRLDLRQSRNTSLMEEPFPIDIRFSDRDPKHAAMIANTIALAYSSVVRTLGPAELDRFESMSFRLVERAQPPTRPASPNIPLLLTIATVLNAILSTLAGIFASNLFR